jgi:hypothetical protein
MMMMKMMVVVLLVMMNGLASTLGRRYQPSNLLQGTCRVSYFFLRARARVLVEWIGRDGVSFGENVMMCGISSYRSVLYICIYMYIRKCRTRVRRLGVSGRERERERERERAITYT